ncbi:hypothetical protein [uncultured Arcticibacterium sp.]|uniref:hypothetical protein n=1 Tax=uncultured Arcticibacterium sp. TaxID=2173042 RepID=UPI0030FAC12B
MSRLSIEVSTEQHRQIKALAVLQGKSIKDFILERLFSGNHSEDTAWQELETVLLHRVENAKSTGKTLEQISQEVLTKNKTA